MFGQDCCTVNYKPQLLEWLKQAKDEKHISEEIYEKIMWKNINKVINLDLDE